MTDKFEARTHPGLFIGWKLAPGGMWTGEYYVVEFQQFLAHLHDARVVHEQTVREVFCNELVKTAQQPFVFPIRVAYERQVRQVPTELFVPLPVAEKAHSDQADGKPPPTSLKAGDQIPSSGDHDVCE